MDRAKQLIKQTYDSLYLWVKSRLKIKKRKSDNIIYSCWRVEAYAENLRSKFGKQEWETTAE